MMGWLGDHLPKGQLALLELHVEQSTIEETPVGYEFHVYETIPPSHITILSDNIDNFVFDEDEDF